VQLDCIVPIGKKNITQNNNVFFRNLKPVLDNQNWVFL
jgi:hypothetical protein